MKYLLRMLKGIALFSSCSCSMKSILKRIFWGLVFARLAIVVYHYMQPYHPIDIQLLQEGQLEATRLIAKYGYPAENHTVETADGYIITLHRIPHSKHQVKKPGVPILLMHGVTGMSSTFFIPGEDNLAFQLANKGYDLWLGNWRGNKYTKHKYLTKQDEKFWNYAMDELADFDLPAMLDYILLKTKHKKLFYIGYSLGAIIGLSAFSWDPKLNEKVAGFVALAPAFKFQYIPTRMFTPWLLRTQQFIAKLRGLFGGHPLLMNLPFSVEPLIPLLCPHHDPYLCYILPSALGGYNLYFLNQTHIPICALQNLEGMNIKTASVFIQTQFRDNTARYDYGPKKNQEIYNSTESPLYPLEKITTPTIFYYAANDAVADPLDVYLVSRKLKNLVKLQLIGPPITCHCDFIMSKITINECVDDIVAELKRLWK